MFNYKRVELSRCRMIWDIVVECME